MHTNIRGCNTNQLVSLICYLNVPSVHCVVSSLQRTGISKETMKKIIKCNIPEQLSHQVVMADKIA